MHAPNVLLMKKATILIVLAHSVLVGYSQSANLVKAKMALSSENYADAVLCIDKAKDHPQTVNNPKTWYYRGEIYFALNENQDYTYSDEPMKVAAQSYFMALSNEDSEGFYRKKSIQRLTICVDDLVAQGIEAQNEGNYTKAMELFETCFTYSEQLKELDLEALFMAAQAAELGGKYNEALAFYVECTTFEYEQLSSYHHILAICKKLNRKELAKSITEEGLEYFPNDYELIHSKINCLLADQSYDEVLPYIDSSLIQLNDNVELHMISAIVNQALGHFEHSEAAYLKAIELDDSQFDAYYNLGTLYLTMGTNMQAEANAEEDPVAAQEMQTAVDAIFVKSIQVLEQAHQIDRTDRGTLTSLRMLHARTTIDHTAPESKEMLSMVD